MKKIVLSIFTVSLLISCANAEAKIENTQGEAKQTAVSTELEGNLKENVSPSIEVPKNLFTKDNKSYILQNTDHDMFDAGGYEDIWIKPIVFRPDGWSTDFIYAQLDFIKGEVTSTAFVIFYPQVNGVLDDKGKISSKTYQIISEEDHPCAVCKLETITIEEPKDVDYPVIKGVFVDRLDATKQTVKYMDYNLNEMDVYWNDVYNFDNVDVEDADSKYNKQSYKKEDVIGDWFQPHFAVRTLEFKENGDVIFYDGSVENEDAPFLGKWSFKSDAKTAVIIVFEKGKSVDLEMPFNLSGGLEKSSFMLTNGKEKFAKNYE